MSKKSFITLSRKECLTFYKDVLENSNQKWDSGIKLAEYKDFGSAISLAIISNEELIKALIIYFDGNGFRLRSIKGINSLFKNHQLRYLVAYGMFSFGSFIDDLTKLIEKIRKDPNLIVTIIESFTKNRPGFEFWISEYLQDKLVTLGKEFDWFSKVDEYRQDGLYCDFKNNIKNPMNITEKEYLFAFSRLQLVRKFGISYIESMNSKNQVLIDGIISLKNKLIEFEVYSKTSILLSIVNNNKGNLFVAIKKHVIEKNDIKDILNAISNLSTGNTSLNNIS